MKRSLLLLVALALVFVWQSNASATISLGITDTTVPIGSGIGHLVPVTITNTDSAAVSITQATFQFVSITDGGILTFTSPLAISTASTTWGTPLTFSLSINSQLLNFATISGSFTIAGNSTSTLANFLVDTNSFGAADSALLTAPLATLTTSTGPIFTAPAAGSITAVPEPGSMALLGLVGSGVAMIGGWRRRRRK